jgi:hypothetical protein
MGEDLMTENTPPEATETNEQSPPLTVTREYVMSQGERQFKLIQYSDDIDVIQTIDSFLKHCQDMGWKIEILGK